MPYKSLVLGLVQDTLAHLNIHRAWSLAACQAQASSARCISSSCMATAPHKTTSSSASKQHGQAPTPSMKWWEAVRAVLLPAASDTVPARSVHASQQSLGQRAAIQSAGAARGPPQMKQSTERLVGNLFKASLVFISLPLFASVMVEQVILPGMLRGLKSQHDSSKENSLKKIQTYILVTRLAERLVMLDGVVSVLSLLASKQSTGVMQQLVACLEHLNGFKPTEKELLMGDVVGKLEQALRNGWFPTECVNQAYTLYLDLHSARRMQLQEMYGPSAQSPPPMPHPNPEVAVSPA